MSKREYTFRQSWLKTATTCPERARREWLGLMPERETDAAAVGTAVHAGIESFLRGEVEEFDDALQVALERFEEIEAHPTFTWAKYSHRVAENLINVFLNHWWGIRYQFDPAEIEYTFNEKFYEDEERIIRVSGTIDLVDHHLGLVDWKTSGRGPYEKWEYERWAIQPTVYSWAYAQTHDVEDQIPFSYAVMHKSGVQQFTVWRSPKDWGWLERVLVNHAIMLEAELPQWTLNDAHALCSAKWCPAWADCKGAHF